jgi:uncharacterized membrane protein (UPF0127 family)
MLMGAFICSSCIDTACADGTPLEMRTDDEKVVARIECAEVARTAAERATGLKGRSQLAPNEGLLLSFPLEGEACISNEEVTFPIDVYFVNQGGLVVAQHSFSSLDQDIACRNAVKWVLEVAMDALSIGIQDVHMVLLPPPT